MPSAFAQLASLAISGRFSLSVEGDDLFALALEERHMKKNKPLVYWPITVRVPFNRYVCYRRKIYAS